MKASTGASWRILPTSPACREVGAPSGSAGLAQASSQGESRAGLLIAVRVQPSPFASGTEQSSVAHAQVLTSILSSYGLSAGDFMFRTLVFDYREPAFGSYPVELILALPVGKPVRAIAWLGDLWRAARGGGQTFEIMDGVRRSKAADLVGNQTIPAQILNAEGKVVGTQSIPINQLLSPKPSIDVSTTVNMTRFMDTLNKTMAGSVPPLITVTPGGRGLPIRDVPLDPIGPNWP